MAAPPSSSSTSTNVEPNHIVFGAKDFVDGEKKVVQQLLERPIAIEHLSQRRGAGNASFTYVESWRAIALANSIFGFNGWSSSVVDITPDYIDQDNTGKFRVGVTAVVKVMLRDGTFHEDVGYGMSENRNKGEAIEKAKKEAVSDARKRALRLFGNALGNSVYDREYTNIAAKAPKSTKRVEITFEALRSSLNDSETPADAASGLPPQRGQIPSGAAYSPSGNVGNGPTGGIPKQPPARSPATRAAPPAQSTSPQPPYQQQNNYVNSTSRQTTQAQSPSSSTSRQQPAPLPPTNAAQAQHQHQHQYPQHQASAQRSSTHSVKGEGHQNDAQTGNEATTEYFPLTEADENAFVAALDGVEAARAAGDMYYSAQGTEDPYQQHAQDGDDHYQHYEAAGAGDEQTYAYAPAARNPEGPSPPKYQKIAK